MWSATSVVIGGCAGSRPPDAACVRGKPSYTLDHGGIVRGDTSCKWIALIFTGGEYGEGTEHILDALRQAGVKASFFVTGQYTAQSECRPLLGRMVAEGHYVGPHSDSHPLYCAWEERSRTLVTEEFFKEDLRTNLDDLKRMQVLADRPIYFIPPYEWFNDEQVGWARDLGAVLFNFTSGSGSNRDWIPEGQPGFVPSDTILRDILDYEQKDPHGLNGFLLLLHLGSLRQDKMHRLAGPLIDELRGRGYRFVRVDEMLRS